MKRAEREAEEAEEARLKELEKPEGDDSQKERENMFAALKKMDPPLLPAILRLPKNPKSTAALLHLLLMLLLLHRNLRQVLERRGQLI